MTELEALILYEFIDDEVWNKNRIWRKIKKIGNGEHVVVINNNVYIWCENDWHMQKHIWKKWIKPSAFKDIVTQIA